MKRKVEKTFAIKAMKPVMQIKEKLSVTGKLMKSTKKLDIKN